MSWFCYHTYLPDTTKQPIKQQFMITWLFANRYAKNKNQSLLGIYWSIENSVWTKKKKIMRNIYDEKFNSVNFFSETKLIRKEKWMPISDVKCMDQ